MTLTREQIEDRRTQFSYEWATDPSSTMDELNALCDMALAYLDAQERERVAPDAAAHADMVLVPREPTEPMLHVGVCQHRYLDGDSDYRMIVSRIYAEMTRVAHSQCCGIRHRGHCSFCPLPEPIRPLAAAPSKDAAAQEGET